MPGVYSRTGVPISVPQLPEAVRARMVDSIVAALLRDNPQIAREKAREIAAEKT